MGVLEFEGYKVLERKWKKYLGGLVKQVTDHIDARLESHMADINEALDRLKTNIANEIQQVKDGLVNVIDGLTAENADLKAQLEAQVAKLDQASARVEGLNTDLEANDPAPADPTV